MPYCPRCDSEQPESNFHRNKHRASGRASYCKPCQLAYRKDYYRRNTEKVKQRVYDRRDAMKVRYQELKTALSCERCGFDHPAALDFHHDDPEKKTLAVSRMVCDGWSEARILQEIEKCSVLCANCHRIEHS